MQKMLTNNNLKNIAAIILLFLVIFAGLILYLKKHQSAEAKPIVLSSSPNKPVPDIKQPKKQIIVEKVTPSTNAKSKTSFSQEIQQMLAPKNDNAAQIEPTNKNILIAIAKSHKGKNDPFAGQKVPAAIAMKSLPPMPKVSSSPVSFSALPSMASLKDASSLDSVPQIEAPTLKLKGFFNNKAIIYFNGKTQIATQGQTVDNIKILQVSDSTSSIKYKMNGKILTASIPSDDDRSKLLKPIK